MSAWQNPSLTKTSHTGGDFGCSQCVGSRCLGVTDSQYTPSSVGWPGFHFGITSSSAARWAAFRGRAWERVRCRLRLLDCDGTCIPRRIRNDNTNSYPRIDSTVLESCASHLASACSMALIRQPTAERGHTEPNASQHGVTPSAAASCSIVASDGSQRPCSHSQTAVRPRGGLSAAPSLASVSRLL